MEPQNQDNQEYMEPAHPDQADTMQNPDENENSSNTTMEYVEPAHPDQPDTVQPHEENDDLEEPDDPEDDLEEPATEGADVEVPTTTGDVAHPEIPDVEVPPTPETTEVLEVQSQTPAVHEDELAHTGGEVFLASVGLTAVALGATMVRAAKQRFNRPS